MEISDNRIYYFKFIARINKNTCFFYALRIGLFCDLLYPRIDLCLGSAKHILVKADVHAFFYPRSLAALFDIRKGMSDPAAVRRKRINGLAGKILLCQKGVHRRCKRVPPHRSSQHNHIIILHIDGKQLDPRAESPVYLALSLIDYRVIISLIRCHSLNAGNVAAHCFLDAPCNPLCISSIRIVKCQNLHVIIPLSGLSHGLRQDSVFLPSASASWLPRLSYGRSP